jgi:hypothetical protein
MAAASAAAAQATREEAERARAESEQDLEEALERATAEAEVDAFERVEAEREALAFEVAEVEAAASSARWELEASAGLDGVQLEPGQWRCRACTVTNEAGPSTACTVCETPRPSDGGKDQVLASAAAAAAHDGAAVAAHARAEGAAAHRTASAAAAAAPLYAAEDAAVFRRRQLELQRAERAARAAAELAEAEQLGEEFEATARRRAFLSSVHNFPQLGAAAPPRTVERPPAPRAASALATAAAAGAGGPSSSRQAPAHGAAYTVLRPPALNVAAAPSARLALAGRQSGDSPGSVALRAARLAAATADSPTAHARARNEEARLEARLAAARAASLRERELEQRRAELKRQLELVARLEREAADDLQGGDPEAANLREELRAAREAAHRLFHDRTGDAHETVLVAARTAPAGPRGAAPRSEAAAAAAAAATALRSASGSSGGGAAAAGPPTCGIKSHARCCAPPNIDPGFEGSRAPLAGLHSLQPKVMRLLQRACWRFERVGAHHIVRRNFILKHDASCAECAAGDRVCGAHLKQQQVIFSGSAGRWSDLSQCIDLYDKERDMREVGGVCAVCRRPAQSADEDQQHFLSADKYGPAPMASSAGPP